MASQHTSTKSKRAEFGDWQTPHALAKDVCQLVSKTFSPKSVFEPNCGRGAFLKTSIRTFPESESFLGLEINPRYAEEARKIDSPCLRIMHDDFFTCGWEDWLRELEQPLLVIGNPPWVTNSELARLRSENLPAKRNLNGLNGIEAITGKSNFDISEWMLIREIEALQGKDAVLAMLCKTAIARKSLFYAWKNELQFSDAAIRQIDAQKHFSVAVDACLLLVRFFPKSDRKECSCSVFASLSDKKPLYVLGLRNGRLVSNADTVDEHIDCISTDSPKFVWRSGIKHDCSKVMELRETANGAFSNGYGELVNIEDRLVYPMLKSSDLANGAITSIRRFMLVPQKRIGCETDSIERACPRTWQYLVNHSDALEKRGSSIYRNRPRFSIFGVGDYSFTPWKIAISGLYKSLRFRVIGPAGRKPVVFDDTCYFLPCDSEAEARIIMQILESPTAQDILDAHIFWDSKRPITRDVLSVLDIPQIARKHGLLADLLEVSPNLSLNTQQTLF